MGRKLYSYKAIAEFYNEKLAPLGYEWFQLREGVLGIGDVVLIAPDEKHYNFVVREVYLNEWSSAQTIRRCAKISKALKHEMLNSLDALPCASRWMLANAEI